jgi:tetratricopeptide (TPR) repeat protein
VISPSRGSAIQKAVAIDPETSVFVGRASELVSLRRLLRDKRFVTVVGPSGIGKSRLLKKYVLSRRGDPIVVVACDLRDARDVDAMIAQVLLAAGGERVPVDDALRATERVLAAKGEVLLVIDNVDPLLPAASVVVQRLLAAAPTLRVLAGSRTPIGLDDAVPETTVELAGLDEEGAVDLAIERVRAAGEKPIGRAVALSVVRKLGFVPLAIELAAGRIGRDEAGALARLGSLPDRCDDERAVQRAIDRAWTLLDDEERELLAETSVFRGGIALDRLAAVSELGARAADVALRLARRGLFEVVEADPVRLMLPASVRAQASEILESNGRTRAVRMRHLRAFDGVQPAIERENVRAAISFAVAEAMHDVALRLCLSLEAASPGVGASRADLAALDAAIAGGGTHDPATLSRALAVRALAVHALGRLQEAKRDAQIALALARQAGDEKQTARATRVLGQSCFQLGELDDARALFERALLIERERGDRGAVSALLQHLGAVIASQGDLELARIHHENALALAVEGEDPVAEARATIGLGSLWLEIGDLQRARTQYERGLAQARRLRMTRTERIVTGYLGLLEFDANRLVEAEGKLRYAASACGDAGDLRVEGVFEGIRGAVLAALGRLPEARGAFARSESALARNAFFAEVIAIHRGHLDLAEARRAELTGDRALAEAHRVYARLRVLDAHDPSAKSGDRTEPPIVLRSDDARIAVRILERAIADAE